MAVMGFGIIEKFGDKTDTNGDPITARVIPEDSDGALTLDLYIPSGMRKFMKNVQLGESVLYAIKRDGTGVILCIVPDYDNDIVDDWDYILRNENVTLQVNGNVHIKGALTVEGDIMTASNALIEGNADIVGNLAADGEAYLGTGIEVTSSGTNIGGTVKIDGVTPTGAKAFNGFPAGVDPMDGLNVSVDTVMASPLAGGKADGNKGNYEKAEDNEERG